MAVLGGLLWVWGTGRSVAGQSPAAGPGIERPTYVTGPRTRGWWAMVILLIVIGMIFLMTIFSYLYLYGIHPQFWTAPPDIGWLFTIVGAHVAPIALALFGTALLARKTSMHWSPLASLLHASGALVAAFVLVLKTWRGARLTGEGAAPRAVVHHLPPLQGIHT